MEHRSVTGFPGETLRDALWEPYRYRLETGEKSDRLLVLVESSTRTAWNERLKSLPFPSGAQRVFTPDAWIRREIEEWWPLLEKHLAPFPSSQRQPLFLAVDLAQHVMANSTRASRLEGLLESARTPLSLQNGQMLDALARSVENGASLFSGLDRESPRRLAREIADRLKCGAAPKDHALLAEVGTALEQYLAAMLELRALDHALALDLFASILWNDPSYRARFLEKTSALLIENLDETSPRLQRIFQQAMELGVSHFSTLQSDPNDLQNVENIRDIKNFRGGLK